MPPKRLTTHLFYFLMLKKTNTSACAIRREIHVILFVQPNNPYGEFHAPHLTDKKTSPGLIKWTTSHSNRDLLNTCSVPGALGGKNRNTARPGLSRSRGSAGENTRALSSHRAADQEPFPSPSSCPGGDEGGNGGSAAKGSHPYK